MTMIATHVYGKSDRDRQPSSPVLESGEQRGRGFGPIGIPALAAAAAFLRRKPQDKVTQHPLPAILWDEHKTS